MPICGRLSPPEGSVCSACSVGTLFLFALLVLQRQLHQRGSILPRISRISRWLGCVIGGVGMAGCHTLLICAYPCLSVEGTSLPECSVCSACSVGHSPHLLCWCCRGSCTSVVVFSHGFHGFPQMVRLRYWRRGYGRDAIPS